MSFITKRRWRASLRPRPSSARWPSRPCPPRPWRRRCTPTGFMRDGINLTAAQDRRDVVTGELDATGCDIAVYNPTRVTNANIHGARYYGVVVNGGNVNTTNSKVHQIGENPFDGTQHGRAILYINGASGTISGNKVYDFQKNGIEVRGVTADASTHSATRTSATIANNVITGQGPIDYIAQNGIVILGNASATVKDNTVSDLWYTPDGTEATGLLNVDAGKDHGVGQHVRRHRGAHRRRGRPRTSWAPRPSRSARTASASTSAASAQPANTDLGTKLDWKIKVDGRVTLHIKQGFGDHDVYRAALRDRLGPAHHPGHQERRPRSQQGRPLLTPPSSRRAPTIGRGSFDSRRSGFEDDLQEIRAWLAEAIEPGGTLRQGSDPADERPRRRPAGWR